MPGVTRCHGLPQSEAARWVDPVDRFEVCFVPHRGGCFRSAKGCHPSRAQGVSPIFRARWARLCRPGDPPPLVFATPALAAVRLGSAGALYFQRGKTTMGKLTEVSGVVLYQPVRRGKRRSRSDVHSVKSVQARANAFGKLKRAGCSVRRSRPTDLGCVAVRRDRFGFTVSGSDCFIGYFVAFFHWIANQVTPAFRVSVCAGERLKIACNIPLWNDSFGRVQGLCDFALNPNKAAPAGVTAPTEA